MVFCMTAYWHINGLSNSFFFIKPTTCTYIVSVHYYMFWWLTFIIRKVKEMVQVNVKFSL